MAANDTLLTLYPQANEPPASDWATINSRNGHPILEFDDTTQQVAIFTCVMPRNYSGAGVTVYVHYSAVATSGTAGWDVAFERVGDGQQDIDSDGFATAQTITAVTVPGTSGHVDIVSVAVTSGANMDSVAVGESFRLRVRRDVANDNASGKTQLVAIELRETGA